MEDKFLSLRDAGVPGGDVVMELGYDFPMKCVIPGDINASIIVYESSNEFHASIMVDWSENIFIPGWYRAGCFLDLFMGFGESGHDHGPEMFGVENNDFVIVVFSLAMVGTSTEEVRLLVGGAGFVMKCEVVLSKFWHPTGLSSVDLLGFLEVLEILMVCPNFEVLVGAH